MVFNLEKEALIASGIREKKQISKYLDKLDCLSHRYCPKKNCHSSPLVPAELLFEALWKDKDKRYRQRGSFRFNEVIDAQLSRKNCAVGNCLGLTLLYNCLLKIMGIEAEALYLENAFGKGPHVLTALQDGDLTIDVENILATGFDYKGHKRDLSRQRWGKKELISDIYQSVGTEFFIKGEIEVALKNYNTALELNPMYEKAELNRRILLDRMQQMQ